MVGAIAFKMTATIGDQQDSVLTSTFLEPKKEPSDLMDYSTPSAPLDLTKKATKILSIPPYSTFQKSYVCSSPPSQNFYEEKQRWTSLGSSPRSNSSADSTELSSTTCDTFLGLTASTTPKTRTTRPFKAYPKDPMSLAIGCTNADLIINSLGTENGDSYPEFRAKMLEQVKSHMTNTTNKNMRRNNSTGSQIDDPSYWEKRRKNNEAAKRSRDARRAKEDEIAIRCAFLEREHIRIKHENVAIKNENTELKYRLSLLETELNRLRNNRFF